ncbi:MAG TPA: cyclic-di-AMP receptor [bacterium]|nr:cyclic-di-AMP receptor [bacterium]
MKLILAIVQEKDSRRLIDALMDAQFQTTMLASTGGFLREGNTTIIIGTDEGRVDDALAVIQKICCVREKLISPVPPVVDPVSYIVEPVKVKVGGAIVSVLNVDRSVKI